MDGLKSGKKEAMSFYNIQKKTEQLTVPFHAGKEVKKGLLTAILKQAKIKTNKR